MTTQIPQKDGTTLVISTLTVQSGLLKDVSIKCMVHHKGLETPISVSMNTKSESTSLFPGLHMSLLLKNVEEHHI